MNKPSSNKQVQFKSIIGCGWVPRPTTSNPGSFSLSSDQPGKHIWHVQGRPRDWTVNLGGSDTEGEIQWSSSRSFSFGQPSLFSDAQPKPPTLCPSHLPQLVIVLLHLTGAGQGCHFVYGLLTAGQSKGPVAQLCCYHSPSLTPRLLGLTDLYGGTSWYHLNNNDNKHF